MRSGATDRNRTCIASFGGSYPIRWKTVAFWVVKCRFKQARIISEKNSQFATKNARQMVNDDFLSAYKSQKRFTNKTFLTTVGRFSVSNKLL